MDLGELPIALGHSLNTLAGGARYSGGAIAGETRAARYGAFSLDINYFKTAVKNGKVMAILVPRWLDFSWQLRLLSSLHADGHLHQRILGYHFLREFNEEADLLSRGLDAEFRAAINMRFGKVMPRGRARYPHRYQRRHHYPLL
jgi:hypothetical protein